MTNDNSYLLDDRIVPVHHHTDERKDAVLIPGPDGQMTVHTGPGAATSASRHAQAPVADLTDTLATAGVLAVSGERRLSLNRRTALRGGLAAVGAMLAPAVAPRFALSSAHAESKGTVIAIFLRGGMDGLSFVAPVGDPDYYRRRPTIAVKQDLALPLTSMFGLNPAAAALMPYWNAGKVAFVHATGNPNPTRSHFEKQFLCETGAAAATVKSGWLGRHLTTSGADTSTFRAFTLGGASAYALSTTYPTLAMASLGAFKVNSAAGVQEQVVSDLHAMWGAAGGPVEAAAMATLAAADQTTRLAGQRYLPANGARYTNSGLSKSLAQVAQVMRSGITPEVVCVDADGWDMHASMGDATGGTAYARIGDLAASLDAFATDLGPDAMGSVTVVAMTEFGRTADENASKGTDHGFGSTMVVLGAGVNGGKVYGAHPGLADSNLDGGALAIGTDYRDALAELVTHRLGNAANLPTILPGYTPRPLGMFTGA